MKYTPLPPAFFLHICSYLRVRNILLHSLRKLLSSSLADELVCLQFSDLLRILYFLFISLEAINSKGFSILEMQAPHLTDEETKVDGASDLSKLVLGSMLLDS